MDILDWEDSRKDIFCWVLGEADLNTSPIRIYSVAFSQYTLHEVPPSQNWSFIGSFINEEAEVVPRPEFDTSKYDAIRMTLGSYEGKLLSKPFALNRTCTVSGCSYVPINGRYVETGLHCGAPVYKNVRNWMIFRHLVKEMPSFDLLISNTYNIMESCYVPPLTERAESAINELVSRKSTIIDGSSYFKKKFADIKKISYRSYITDKEELPKRKNSLTLATELNIDSVQLDFTSNDEPFSGDDIEKQPITFQTNLKAKHNEYAKQVLIEIEKREIVLEKLLSLLKGSDNEGYVVSDIDYIIQDLEKFSNDTLNALKKWAGIFDKQPRKNKANRKYCVVISSDSEQIYAASASVHSSLMRYNRGPEPSRRYLSHRFIGAFETMNEAEEAFLSSIAQSAKGNVKDKSTIDNNMYVSMRSCMKHYLIRSKGVSRTIPCETCISSEFADIEYYTLNSKAVFVWKGMNYLEKMKNDINVLGSYKVMSHLISRLRNIIPTTYSSQELEWSTKSSLKAQSSASQLTSNTFSNNSLELRNNNEGKDLTIYEIKAFASQRRPDIWCDVENSTEFRGLTQGKHSRALFRQELLKAKGIERKKYIRRLQKLIRICVKAGVGIWKVDDIIQLLSTAKKASDRALEIDITNLEKHLQRTKSAMSCVLKLQARFRGYRGRRQFAEVVLMRKREKKHLEEVRTFASKMSNVFVSSILASCCESVIKQRSKPICSQSISVKCMKEDKSLLMSVYLATSQFSKLTNLCTACQNITSAALKPTELRVGCTCNLVENNERWKIITYDPLTSEHRTHLVDMHYLKACIVKYKWQTPGDVPMTMVDKLLNKITESERLMKASHKKNYKRVINLNQDSHLWLVGGWEPINNYQILKQNREFLIDMVKRIDENYDIVSESDFIGNFIHDRTDISYEQACMSLEDSLGEYERLKDLLVDASLRISRIMISSVESAIYSTDLVPSTLTIDSNLTEWKQAWRDFVDGNAWQGINCKRRIQATLSKQLELIKAKQNEKILKEDSFTKYINFERDKRIQLRKLKMLKDEYMVKITEANESINDSFAMITACLKIMSTFYPSNYLWNPLYYLQNDCRPLNVDTLDDYPWILLRRETISVYKHSNGKLVLPREYEADGIIKKNALIDVYIHSDLDLLLLHVHGNDIEETVYQQDKHDSWNDYSMLMPTWKNRNESPSFSLASTTNAMKLLSKYTNNSSSFHCLSDRNIESLMYNRHQIADLIVSNSPCINHYSIQNYDENLKTSKSNLCGNYVQHFKNRNEINDSVNFMLKGLRWQPFTDRISLGFYYLSMRKETFNSVWIKSVNYNDHCHSEKTSTQSHSQILCEIDGKVYFATILWSMTVVDVNLTHVYNLLDSITIKISILDLASNILSYDSALLGVFLINHITNRYSDIIIQHLLRSLSISFNIGHPMLIRPKVEFLKNINEKSVLYKFSCLRLLPVLSIKEQWFKITFIEDFNRNLTITLTSPLNTDIDSELGMCVSSRQYNGNDLVMSFRYEEVRAIVFKILSKNKNICANDLIILHPNHREAMYNILLQGIKITDIRSLENKKSWLNEMDYAMQCQILDNVKCFKLWNSKQSHPISDLFGRMPDNMHRSSEPSPQYECILARSETNKGSSISVHSSVQNIVIRGNSFSPNLFGSRSEQISHDSTILSGSHLERKICRVNVNANTDEQCFEITINIPNTSETQDAEICKIFQAKETEFMAQEDEYSISVERFAVSQQLTVNLKHLITEFTQYLKVVLIPRYTEDLYLTSQVVKKLRQTFYEIETIINKAAQIEMPTFDLPTYSTQTSTSAILAHPLIHQLRTLLSHLVNTSVMIVLDENYDEKWIIKESSKCLKQSELSFRDLSNWYQLKCIAPRNTFKANKSNRMERYLNSMIRRTVTENSGEKLSEVLLETSPTEKNKLLQHIRTNIESLERDVNSQIALLKHNILEVEDIILNLKEILLGQDKESIQELKLINKEMLEWVDSLKEKFPQLNLACDGCDSMWARQSSSMSIADSSFVFKSLEPIYCLYVPCDKMCPMEIFSFSTSKEFVEKCRNILDSSDESDEIRRVMTENCLIYSRMLDFSVIKNKNGLLNETEYVLSQRNERLIQIHLVLSGEVALSPVSVSFFTGDSVILFRKGIKDLMKLAGDFNLNVNDVKGIQNRQSNSETFQDLSTVRSLVESSTEESQDESKSIICSPTTLSQLCDALLPSFEFVYEGKGFSEPQYELEIVVRRIIQIFWNSIRDTVVYNNQENFEIVSEELLEDMNKKLLTVNKIENLDLDEVKCILVSLLHSHCVKCVRKSHKNHRCCKVPGCSSLHPKMNDFGMQSVLELFNNVSYHLQSTQEIYQENDVILKSIDGKLGSGNETNLNSVKKDIQNNKELLNWRILLLQNGRLMNYINQHIQLTMRPLFFSDENMSGYVSEFRKDLTIKDEKIIRTTVPEPRYKRVNSLFSVPTKSKDKLVSINLNNETVKKVLSEFGYHPLTTHMETSWIFEKSKFNENIVTSKRLIDKLTPLIRIVDNKGVSDLEYDRLLAEEPIRLNSGLVIVRVLQGILIEKIDKSPILHSSRFCSMTTLSKVSNGLTIVVDDVLGRVTQSAVMCSSALPQLHQYLGTCSGMRDLAQAMLEKFPVISTLEFINGQFTSITLDIARLYKDRNYDALKPSDMTSGIKQFSQKHLKYKVEQSSTTQRAKMLSSFD